MAVDADFSFLGEVAMFKIFMFVALYWGCRGLKPVSDNMARYVSSRWTGDGLSGEARPGWTVPLVREGELLLLGFTLSPHPRRPAASRISCVISSG